MIAFEDEVQELVVIEVGAEALDGNTRGQGGSGAVEEHDDHLGFGLLELTRQDVGGEGRGVSLDEMKEARHQKMTKRSARGR